MDGCFQAALGSLFTYKDGQVKHQGREIRFTIFRMPYPPSEVEYNSVNCAEAIANQGGDDPEVKIWWIP